MDFLVTFIQTVIKMIFVGAFGFAGIMFGKYLRKRKDEKSETAK